MRTVLNPTARRGAGAAAALSLAAGVLAATPASAAPAPDYVLTDLGHAGTGTTASAAGLNDRGVAVGTGRTTAASRPQVGLRWPATGGAPTTLGLLDGATFARAFDVNNAGTAVGEAWNAAGGSVAARWDERGAITSVGSLNPAGTGVANDVNDAGTVVGSSYNGTVVRAYRSTATGLAELPVPEVPAGQSVAASVATAIADNGTIVGWASVLHPADADEPVAHSVQTPAVWFGDGSRQVLVSPGGHDSTAVATGVSDQDVIVGYSTTGGTDTAARWQASAITPLPPVENPGTPGKAWRHSRALAVDGDLAVGYSSTNAGSYSFGGSATLWDRGVATDLNDVVDLPSGWTLLAATDVNRAGQISGVASVNGTTKAVLLTPVADPAPTSLTIQAAAATYGRASTVTVAAGRGVTGRVELFDGARSIGAGQLVDGSASIRIGGTVLEPGRRTLTARFAGTAEQEAATASVTVAVARARSSVKATVARSKTVVDRTRRTVKVTVRAGGTVPTGRVSVRIGGKRVDSATLRGGRVSIRLPRFDTTGTKRVHVVFAGSSRVEPSRSKVSITVSRR